MRPLSDAARRSTARVRQCGARPGRGCACGPASAAVREVAPAGPQAGRRRRSGRRAGHGGRFVAGLQHVFQSWRKPFNPILGETWQAHLADGTSIFLEQISHHPPVSAFQLTGPGARLAWPRALRGVWRRGSLPRATARALTRDAAPPAGPRRRGLPVQRREPAGGGVQGQRDPDHRARRTACLVPGRPAHRGVLPVLHPARRAASRAGRGAVHGLRVPCSHESRVELRLSAPRGRHTGDGDAARGRGRRGALC